MGFEPTTTRSKVERSDRLSYGATTSHYYTQKQMNDPRVEALTRQIDALEKHVARLTLEQRVTAMLAAELQRRADSHGAMCEHWQCDSDPYVEQHLHVLRTTSAEQRDAVRVTLADTA